MHFNNNVPPDSSAVRGGVKVRVLIRLDFRQYQTGKPFNLPNASGLFRQTEVSAGFSLAL